MKHWHNLKDTVPANGQCVVILFTNNEKDPDFWTTDEAYYCNGDFYKLEYDPILDILRKVYVKEQAKYWSNIVMHDPAEVKE